MSIPVHNVAYYRGDTYRLVANFYKSDGTPVTLSGGTLLAWIVTDPAQPTTTKVGTGWTIAVTGTNTATLTITSTYGAALTPGTTYYYDVQFKQTSVSPPDVYTFFTGTITVQGDITEGADLV